MMMKLDLNDTATLLGIVFGLSGFVLGIVNHLRDRAKVTVSVNWDMSMTPNPTYDPSKSWAVINVANVGRRPIYLSHASLRIPKGYGTSHLLLADSVAGKKLAEGDPPLTFPVDQTGLEKYAKDWQKIRAEIIDSTGRKWRSKRLRKKERPSWAKAPEGEQPPERDK
ncbi:MAG: hypothetical protein K9M96_08765 [Deltaproteobacteria bacterium]|nr:hypothetical protein [Deltaproteobacteria bacterium]